MKEAYYFPHDTNATQDPKMMRLLMSWGLAGIGAFWVIIEMLHQQPDGKINVGDLDSALDFYSGFEDKTTNNPVDYKDIKDILESCGLLSKEEGYYFSSRVLRNKEARVESSQKHSESGKRGAEARWRSNEKMATAWQPHGEAMAPLYGEMANDGKGKERKGKERKEEEKKEKNYSPDFLAFWQAYPNKTGKDKAFEAWGKKAPVLEACLSALKWQTAQPQWAKEGGKYIPHPTTWLNQGRWNDEPIIARAGSTAGPVAGKYDDIGERA